MARNEDAPPALEAYKETTDTWRGVSRRELSGKRGETQGFHVRYFEIAPGGYSTLERHQHEHVVIPIRGQGEVQFGCSIYRVGFGDVVHVAPGDPHQPHARGHGRTVRVSVHRARGARRTGAGGRRGFLSYLRVTRRQRRGPVAPAR